MSIRVGYLAAAVMAGGIMSFSITDSASAQVLDGTRGGVSRCDLYRSLGRALPPECGGTGQGLAGVTRGRVQIAPPSSPATAPVATAPAPAAAPAAAPAPRTAAAPTREPTFASPPPAPAAAGAEPRTAKGVGLPIPFEIDSDVLKPQAMAIIDQLVEVFKANGSDRYLIEGHTDVSGDTAHNQALSERRAKAVVRYLVERHGLPEARFSVRGQGSASLLLPEDPRNARNRRVAIMGVDG